MGYIISFEGELYFIWPVAAAWFYTNSFFSRHFRSALSFSFYLYCRCGGLVRLGKHRFHGGLSLYFLLCVCGQLSRPKDTQRRNDTFPYDEKSAETGKQQEQ